MHPFFTIPATSWVAIYWLAIAKPDPALQLAFHAHSSVYSPRPFSKKYFITWPAEVLLDTSKLSCPCPEIQLMAIPALGRIDGDLLRMEFARDGWMEGWIAPGNGRSSRHDCISRSSENLQRKSPGEKTGVESRERHNCVKAGKSRHQGHEGLEYLQE